MKISKNGVRALLDRSQQTRMGQLNLLRFSGTADSPCKSHIGKGSSETAEGGFIPLQISNTVPDEDEFSFEIHLRDGLVVKSRGNTVRFCELLSACRS